VVTNICGTILIFSIGLDDVGDQPKDDKMIDWLRNHYESLLEKRHYLLQQGIIIEERN
jgi:hypothetical protein